MQFKSLLTIVGLAALAAAAPKEKRDDVATLATLTTRFTTQTFTATRILQSFMEVEPWVTTITTPTTWTVAHTVTVPVADATARK